MRLGATPRRWPARPARGRRPGAPRAAARPGRVQGGADTGALERHEGRARQISLARQPDRIAGTPAQHGVASPDLLRQLLVAGGADGPAEHELAAGHEEEVGAQRAPVDPRHPLRAIGVHQPEEVVGGHGHRGRAKARLVGDAQDAVHHAAVRAGHEDAPGVACGLRGSPGSDRKSKAASSAGNGRWRSSSNRTISRMSPPRAGKSTGLTVTTDRDRPMATVRDGQLARVELRAQRHRGLLGLDHERLRAGGPGGRPPRDGSRPR